MQRHSCHDIRKLSQDGQIWCKELDEVYRWCSYSFWSYQEEWEGGERPFPMGRWLPRGVSRSDSIPQNPLKFSTSPMWPSPGWGWGNFGHTTRTEWKTEWIMNSRKTVARRRAAPTFSAYLFIHQRRTFPETFQPKIISGQVTRSGQVTLPQKVFKIAQGLQFLGYQYDVF